MEGCSQSDGTANPTGFSGLASFRTSQWDPREELPEDYARIFQFQHFKQTRKRVLSKMPTPENAGDWVMPGTMVTLHIVNVPASYPAVLAAQGPVTIFGLLEHENKMSLLNFKLTMHSSCVLHSLGAALLSPVMSLRSPHVPALLSLH